MSGLPASTTEVCLALWRYKTSSDPESPEYVSPLPEVDGRLSQASLVFGFTAAVNCSDLSRDFPATVTLSTDTALEDPTSSLLGCWSTPSGWSFSESSVSSVGSTASEEVSASLPLAAGTEMCSWFQPSVGFSTETLENVPIYTTSDKSGSLSASGMPGWVVGALCGVVGVLVLAMAVVAAVVIVRRRRADAEAQAAQLRAASVAKAPWESNPLSTDPQQPRPPVAATRS